LIADKFLKKLLATVFPVLIFSFSSAEEINYPSSAIPEFLKTNAHAVIRLNQMEVEMTAPGEGRISEKVAVTILDAEGNSFNEISRFYDRFHKITDISGVLYDKNGKKIKKLSNKDIRDQSAVDYQTLFADIRVRWAALNYTDYPYTVEFTVESNFKALINSIEWMPVQKEHTSLQGGMFTVKLLYNTVINYHSNSSIEPAISSNTDSKIYSWHINSMIPVKLEQYGPPPSEQFLHVDVSPRQYKIEAYKNDINSWEDMSRYFFYINKDRDILNYQTSEQVKSLVAGKSKKEAVKILYNYLQENTRYVSIQLGLGGWQCYDANYVDKYKLGDCKALSNYMKALLKSAGIESFQAIICAGNNPSMVDSGFVTNQFNHVIVFIPDVADTMWLECTSQLSPFNYLSDFTQNRYCLPLKEKGSGLIKTPSSNENDNIKTINADLTLDSLGKISGKLNIAYTGTLSDEAYYFAGLATGTKFNEWINSNLKLYNGSVSDYHLVNSVNDIARTEIDCSYKPDRLFTEIPAKVFFKGCLFNRDKELPTIWSERQFNVVNNFAYTEEDITVIHLPSKCSIESFNMDEQKKDSEFGSYSFRIFFDGEQHSMTIKRKLAIKEFNLPKDKSKDLKAFLTYVFKADQSEIVIVKK
jgi:hypothetical protein